MWLRKSIALLLCLLLLCGVRGWVAQAAPAPAPPGPGGASPPPPTACRTTLSPAPRTAAAPCGALCVSPFTPARAKSLTKFVGFPQK